VAHVLFKSKEHVQSSICYGKTSRKKKREERNVTEPLKPQKKLWNCFWQEMKKFPFPWYMSLFKFFFIIIFPKRM